MKILLRLVLTRTRLVHTGEPIDFYPYYPVHMTHVETEEIQKIINQNRTEKNVEEERKNDQTFEIRWEYTDRSTPEFIRNNYMNNSSPLFVLGKFWYDKNIIPEFFIEEIPT